MNSTDTGKTTAFITPANKIPAREALRLLREGNQRFVASDGAPTAVGHTRRAQLAKERQPFAIILGCSDARVPVEIIFDQGLGDLFVIRVAGNIIAPSLIGSVEFAAEYFGTRLVVVLGHSHCGAVLATINELQHQAPRQSHNLGSIINRVRPSVEGLLRTDLRHDMDALVHQAVRANVSNAVNHLRHGSEILEHLEHTDGLRMVGAEYSLETGVVDFFDGAQI